MTVWAVLLAYVGALDPFRRRGCLSVTRPRDVVVGAALACASYVALATIAAGVRDSLDVSAPNARLTAALVLLAVGLHAVLTPLPRLPVADVPRAWLAPVWFPVLFRPDLALVALAADGAAAVGVVALAAALGLVLTVGWWRAAPASRVGPRTERGLGALVGALLVLAAVRLLLDGLFAI